MKSIGVAVFLLVSTLGFSQILTQETLNSGRRPVGKFNSYITKTGDEIKVGDTLKIGQPSGVNGKFVYFQKIDIMGQYYVVGAEATSTNAIIKSIRVSGTNRSGFKAAIQTKGLTAIDNYFLNYEDAVLSGELQSDGMTSDQALEELKKAKTKLDLEVIDQVEYDKIKEELMKYIK